MFEGEDCSEYLRHILGEWVMARGELDLHRLGRFPCPSFPAADSDGEKPEVPGYGRGRAFVSFLERDGSDVFDFFSGYRGLGNFPGGEHWSSVGLFVQDV